LKLYHGTSGERLKAILERGVEPRGERMGNFGHTLESCPDAVYLTDTYPLYFAVGSIRQTDPKPWIAAVVEIDTGRLDRNLLNADEDVLEQLGRGRDGLPATWEMARRTEHYRDLLKTMRFDWQGSLLDMGTCCHLGTIPVGAITRVATVDVLLNPYVAHAAMQAQVSLPNFAYCSREYRALTRWIFGDDDESDLPPTHDLGGGYIHQEYRWPPAPHREGIRVWAPGEGP